MPTSPSFWPNSRAPPPHTLVWSKQHFQKWILRRKESSPSKSSGRWCLGQPSLLPIHNLCRTLVRGLSHGLLNEHEIITLGRHYGEHGTPPLASLIPIIQQDLRRNNYKEFQKLLNSLSPHATGGSVYVEQEMLKYVCKTLQVPLSDQLIDGTIMK